MTSQLLIFVLCAFGFQVSNAAEDSNFTYIDNGVLRLLVGGLLVTYRRLGATIILLTVTIWAGKFNYLFMLDQIFIIQTENAINFLGGNSGNGILLVPVM